MHPDKTNTRNFRTVYIDNNKSIDCTVSPTFKADIYVGYKQGYNGAIPTFASQMADKICQDYCDSIGFAVTVEETHFIYKDGSEPGIKVGLINYPRYPSTKEDIVRHALTIAERLKNEFEQIRVSVVTSDLTYLIGDLD